MSSRAGYARMFPVWVPIRQHRLAKATGGSEKGPPGSGMERASPHRPTPAKYPRYIRKPKKESRNLSVVAISTI